MTPERAFRLSSILLASAGFSGLVLTGKLPVALAELGLIALALSLAQAGGWGAGWLIFRLSRGAWNAIMIAALVTFGVEALWVSQDFLQAGVHFLVILMINKLLNLQQRKDFLHLYAVSLLELLASAALTVDLWYAAVFVTYLMAAIWTLLLYHLRNEAEEAATAGQGPSDPTKAPGPITAQFFWTTNAIAVGALCLTLAIFFVTPRTGVGFFQKNRVQLIRTSGFSEKVDLGVIGIIKQDETVVMRVELPDQKGPVAQRLYYRGAAYDTYNGRLWANSHARRRPLARSSDGVFTMPVSGPAEERPGTLRQEILLEALDTPALFGVPAVDSVKGPFSALQADAMGGLFLPYPPSSRFQYTVFSTPERPVEQDRAMASLSFPEPIRERYLQLPGLSGRVAALTREVTRQAKTPYEMTAAVERHLQDSYHYSLDVTAEPSANPIEDFLFRRKTGYCEHYATAMVMMLRTVGIPARLVTGFLQGEWNDFGNYYTVRQRDAHAWVEVFFPRSGWITFDPTPSEGAVISSPFWTKLGRIVDSIRLKWDRLVIQYSFRDQMAVAQSLREQGDKARSQISALASVVSRWATAWSRWVTDFLYAPGWGWAGGLIGGALLAGLLVATWMRANRWIRPGSQGLATSRQLAAARLYSRMLRLLESRGIRKTPGSTPLEFARLVATEWAEASRFVEPLTALYYRVRFGHAPLSVQDLEQAHDLLARLRAVRG